MRQLARVATRQIGRDSNQDDVTRQRVTGAEARLAEVTGATHKFRLPLVFFSGIKIQAGVASQADSKVFELCFTRNRCH